MKTNSIQALAGKAFREENFNLGTALRLGAVFFICGISIAALAKDEQVVDPFEPAVTAPSGVPGVSAAQADLNLEGIGIGPDNAYVILNGQIISEGEERDGIKIVKINKKDVNVLYGGSEMKLRMSAAKETRGS